MTDAIRQSFQFAAMAEEGEFVIGKMKTRLSVDRGGKVFYRDPVRGRRAIRVECGFFTARKRERVGVFYSYATGEWIVLTKDCEFPG